ncbi:hypothetical protein ACJJTC_004932 [Scirpophaga incertulas]
MSVPRNFKISNRVARARGRAGLIRACSARGKISLTCLILPNFQVGTSASPFPRHVGTNSYITGVNFPGARQPPPSRQSVSVRVRRDAALTAARCSALVSACLVSRASRSV